MLLCSIRRMPPVPSGSCCGRTQPRPRRRPGGGCFATTLPRRDWGPRLDDILRASLATLARSPGMTLCEIAPLLTNTAFRRRLVAGIDDPVASGRSSSSSVTAAAPSGSRRYRTKLRAVLGRRAIRNVVGQSEGLVIADLLAERKVLVVNLAKGLVGEDAVALLGSLVLTSRWQALQGRAGVPTSERQRTYVYLDEFQDYLTTRVSLADALAQARGYGVGFVLAHQFVGQLPADIRQAVLGTVASKAVFQCGADDARTLAREFAPYVDPEDLQGLPAYTAYAQLSVNTAVLAPTSLTTLPQPPPTADPAKIRDQSRHCYGTPIADVERRSGPAVRHRRTSFRRLGAAEEHESGRLSHRCTSHTRNRPCDGTSRTGLTTTVSLRGGVGTCARCLRDGEVRS
jgi:hypothetical protein